MPKIISLEPEASFHRLAFSWQKVSCPSTPPFFIQEQWIMKHAHMKCPNRIRLHICILFY